MNTRQTLLVAAITSLFFVAAIAGSLLISSRAAAAPAAMTVERAQEPADNFRYASVSALGFIPANQSAPFNKDVRRQFLSLTAQDRNFPDNSNLFIAPLSLPDEARLTGMAVFGEDFDNQGAVAVNLKRCDHGQARCVNLVEATSTDSYAAGQFQLVRIANLNQIVDNNQYSYFLELELTALVDSGLRSVRLEMANEGPGNPPPSGGGEQWSLSGDVRSFIIPVSGWAQVQVCTDDLSHLPNQTHYPTLVVDGQSTTLGSNTCVTVWGRNIQLRRELNTGPSSGTYQILR